MIAKEMRIMATRTVLALSDEARAVIARRTPSENKRGAWVSAALVAYDKLLSDQEANDPRRMARLEDELQAIKQLLVIPKAFATCAVVCLSITCAIRIKKRKELENVI